MKKLSICIPTYNRSGFLDTLLSSLVAQIATSGRGDEIEVLVSDNASPDDTPSIAAKYEGAIRYWRNPENIGPDANFLKLFGQATGSYIWLPGDDDTVRDDTLRYILRMIDTNEFDFLYLRTQGSTSKDWLTRGAAQVSNVELLRRVNIFTTFMTSQVIRADLIKPNLEQARTHLGGFMAYYWIFLEALHRSARCLISEEREVFPDTTENTGGYRFYKVWAEAVFDVLKASSFGADAKSFAIMRFRMFFALLLPITYRLRSGGARFKFQSENPAAGLQKYFGSGIYRPIVSTYLGLPYVLLKPVHFAMRVVLRITRACRNDIV
ncbi:MULTISPECIES: glycosyltransferase family 2 protein [unclassified Pandoraea]|uniref:glycosyltransferase family 2 protein n=1 Tax=unclassified Pandoraea TaxID=2624094 RepID=UPI000B406C05|nr:MULTISPECIES: glycosyltransferase family 2 protein [unclassified Pandoraea]